MAKRAPGNRTTVGVNWIEGFELMYSMANNGDGSMTITMTGSSPVTLDNHAPAALITQLVIGDLTAGFRGTIRNVKIFDENDQLIHFWQVNDNDTAIADSVGAITGSLAIGNGYWY